MQDDSWWEGRQGNESVENGLGHRIYSCSFTNRFQWLKIGKLIFVPESHIIPTKKQQAGEVYNVGGGRHASCSILEAISMCEQITGKRLNHTYEEANRNGDHISYISDVSKFKRHFPEWNYTYDLKQILSEIYLNITLRHEHIENY